MACDMLQKDTKKFSGCWIWTWGLRFYCQPLYHQFLHVHETVLWIGYMVKEWGPKKQYVWRVDKSWKHKILWKKRVTNLCWNNDATLYAGMKHFFSSGKSWIHVWGLGFSEQLEICKLRSWLSAMVALKHAISSSLKFMTTLAALMWWT